MIEVEFQNRYPFTEAVVKTDTLLILYCSNVAKFLIILTLTIRMYSHYQYISQLLGLAQSICMTKVDHIKAGVKYLSKYYLARICYTVYIDLYRTRLYHPSTQTRTCFCFFVGGGTSSSFSASDIVFPSAKRRSKLQTKVYENWRYDESHVALARRGLALITNGFNKPESCLRHIKAK